MRMHDWNLRDTDGHDGACEAEWVLEAAAYTPCRCEERAQEQPMPAPYDPDKPVVVDELVKLLGERRALGVQRYGTPLQAFNGRDMARDALEEAIDLSVYLMGMILESRAEQERYRCEARESAQTAGKALRELGEAQAELATYKNELGYADKEREEAERNRDAARAEAEQAQAEVRDADAALRRLGDKANHLVQQLDAAGMARRRIADAHHKHVDGHGGTWGECNECGNAWPCPTYAWATTDRDPLATWDPADDPAQPLATPAAAPVATDEPEATGCPRCGHDMGFHHDPEGCRFTATTAVPGTDLTCGCPVTSGTVRTGHDNEPLMPEEIERLVPQVAALETELERYQTNAQLLSASTMGEAYDRIAAYDKVVKAACRAVDALLEVHPHIREAQPVWFVDGTKDLVAAVDEFREETK